VYPARRPARLPASTQLMRQTSREQGLAGLLDPTISWIVLKSFQMCPVVRSVVLADGP